ncbi:MbtH family protein [Actinomadura gamaensis]|uniref:MbtH family protein n=1 Tax=Actinomadura gamaensis TaxID=1763541 RepID=A0ABV9TVZ8_9ACTN
MTDDDQRFHVVVNDEEQYSIWPETMPLPPGWTAAGHSGPKQDCLAHIERVWTDMRPRGIRPSHP